MPFDLTTESILAFLRDHALFAPIVVFFLAMGETLVIVSVFIPSSIILFGLGGLLAAGGVPLWPSLLGGALGASCGFLLSYLLGTALQNRIFRIWPFRNYPELIDRAVAMAHKRGAVGVMAGHFFGPLRPFVPVAAGIARMRPGPFMAANIPGACAWICVFLAPSYLIATSETFSRAFSSAYAAFGKMPVP